MLPCASAIVPDDCNFQLSKFFGRLEKKDVSFGVPPHPKFGHAVHSRGPLVAQVFQMANSYNFVIMIGVINIKYTGKGKENHDPRGHRDIHKILANKNFSSFNC